MKELQDFWDTHSLTEYWDETREVRFEIAPELRRKLELRRLYCVLGLDSEQIAAVEHRAEKERIDVPRLLAKWVVEQITRSHVTVAHRP